MTAMASLEIRTVEAYRTMDTPFGEFCITAVPEGVVAAQFVWESESEDEGSQVESSPQRSAQFVGDNRTNLEAEVDGSKVERSEEMRQAQHWADEAERQLSEYFAGVRTDFELPLVLQGTEFQQKVWQTLQLIPYGETRSYREVATLAGNPKAVRAVGQANRRNPVSIIVPCHRVIGANGSMVGYAGPNVETKAELLRHENGLRLGL